MGKKIQNIKEKIEDFEYYQNGFKHLSGAWVKAKNLRWGSSITKDNDRIICDVTLCSGEGEPEELYKDCEYPLEKLEGALTT